MQSGRSLDQPFPKTRWTLVAKLDESVSESQREDALSELCQAYWPPIYAFLRSRGNSSTEAEDLTQGFFADFLSRDHFAAARPEVGRLRNYLLRSVTNYANRIHRDQNRVKRGGQVQVISVNLVDEEGNSVILEPTTHVTPEVLFERQWALTLLQRVFERISSEYRAKGKENLFEALRFVISNQEEQRSYAEVAKELGSSENAIKIAAHRLRERYQRTIRVAVEETMLPGENTDVELRELMGAFRAS